LRERETDLFIIYLKFKYAKKSFVKKKRNKYARKVSSQQSQGRKRYGASGKIKCPNVHRGLLKWKEAAGV
jgi:hypothetical protein